MNNDIIKYLIYKSLWCWRFGIDEAIISFHDSCRLGLELDELMRFARKYDGEYWNINGNRLIYLSKLIREFDDEGDGVMKTTDGKIKLFISHSSKDIDVAELLIDLFEHALHLPSEKIRCTSIDGYRLPAGANTKEQLRQEIFDADTFIGLISPESLQSSFVLFELGARWGASRHLVPVLVPGVDANILKKPLDDFNAISCSNAAQLHQLVQDIGRLLQIEPDVAASYEKIIEHLIKLRT